MLTGRIAIAAVALTHTLFATFIVGATFLGSLTETAGVVSKSVRHDRLAHLIAFTVILSTAAVSFFGVILVFLLNIFWPHFWSTLFRVMFWPILLEASFFLGEAIFAYAWYYTWDWNISRRVHVMFGWLAAACALLAMVMIDIVASFMLTPGGLQNPWDRIFNPSMMHLDLHRVFGNIVWTGFALAAICAIGLLRATDWQDKKFYHWAGAYCFMFGFGALLVMPIIGYQYLLQIRYAQPQAFHTLMLGGRSWLFDLVALLFGLLVVLGSLYAFRVMRLQTRRPAGFDMFLPVSLILLILATVVFALPYHIQHIPFVQWVTAIEINPWGKMQPFKYFAMFTLVIFGIFNLVYFVLGFFKGDSDQAALIANSGSRTPPGLLVLLCGVAMLMMLTMGWSRETARAYNGYLIYGKFRLADEAQTYDVAPSPSTTDMPSRAENEGRHAQ